MTDRRTMPVRILEQSPETLLGSKDEEYAYWQSRPPGERLTAMLELSLAFHEDSAMKLKLGPDFRDLLRALRVGDVEYLIIGGWAVTVHAQPRATQDLDIFVGSDAKNLAATYAALLQFGAPLDSVDKAQFLKPGTYFRLGAPPNQIDIFSAIPGVDFASCWPKRITVVLDSENDLSANIISAEDLIAAKIASGRQQDLADAEAIRRAQQEKPKA